MSPQNDDIDNILKNSTKAEFLEALTRALEDYDKAVIILVQDREDGSFGSTYLTLGITRTYEAYGLLEVAKQDLELEEYD